MAKDKFKKRKDRRRLIRGEMTKRGISGKEIAARVGITEQAVSQGCATSPRVVAVLIEAGIPARLFGKNTPSPQAKSPLAPLCQRGGEEGEGEKEAATCGF